MVAYLAVVCSFSFLYSIPLYLYTIYLFYCWIITNFWQLQIANYTRRCIVYLQLIIVYYMRKSHNSSPSPYLYPVTQQPFLKRLLFPCGATFVLILHVWICGSVSRLFFIVLFVCSWLLELCLKSWYLVVKSSSIVLSTSLPCCLGPFAHLCKFKRHLVISAHFLSIPSWLELWVRLHWL